MHSVRNAPNVGFGLKRLMAATIWSVDAAMNSATIAMESINNASARITRKNKSISNISTQKLDMLSNHLMLSNQTDRKEQILYQETKKNGNWDGPSSLSGHSK